jgi:hypothetical protein
LSLLHPFSLSACDCRGPLACERCVRTEASRLNHGFRGIREQNPRLRNGGGRKEKQAWQKALQQAM